MDKLAEIEQAFSGVLGDTNSLRCLPITMGNLTWLVEEIKRLREQQSELIEEIDSCTATRHAATRLWIANQAAYAIEQALSTRVV
jgi:hypothetical protein